MAAACAVAIASVPVRARDSVILSEFMAANTRTLKADTKTFDDWIELRNVSSNTVDLAGWALTDHPRKLRAWVFPATNLPAGGHLLVWASGRNHAVAGAPLHANFKLSSSGEYLALVRPDGTVATAFAPKYPPQSTDVSYGFLPGVEQPVYFLAPTPGQANELSTNPPGPRILALTHEPAAPKGGGGAAVTITAHVQPLLRSPADAVTAVTNVTLWWRAQFHRETNILMTAQGEGTWNATIPAEQVRDGEILRWRVTAQDAAGHASRWPLAGNPRLASRYDGLVINPQPVRSALPVFHLFMAPQQLGAADSDSGARGCFVYDGEFYDNVLVKVRGNTTAGFPKKSHRLEFPHDHPLRHPGPGGRVRHTSLVAEFGDPSYLRQHLSFWLQAETGSAAPFHYPVRVQLNGDFWQLAMHSEVLDEELLARYGLDSGGALYKAVGTLTPDFNSSGGFEKKTRRQEDESDYLALANALSESQNLEARRRHFFDLMNVPSVINYLAVARLTQEDDDIWANLSLYHDCDGTREWRPIPFDMNVSWGLSFAHGDIQATNDSVRSHPFFGASGVGLNQGYNRLYDVVVRLPETRQMLLRRMRTILDEWWQPPGTPLAERRIEQHITVITNLMWEEAVLDRKKWGATWHQPRPRSPEQALPIGVRELIDRFIEPRRTHFYVTHSVTNTSRAVGTSRRNNVGLPEAQPPDVRVQFADLQPSPDQPRQAYLSLTNATPNAIDLSGWRIDGAAKYVIPPGTVLPANGLLYVSADVRAFRQRATGPRGGQGCFVIGNLKGALSKDGSVTLQDAHGRRVASIGP